MQGRIDYQNQLIIVDRSGNVTYFARFSATFQAPDFDFRRFPLDHQNFHLKLDSLLPLDTVVFKAIPGGSGLGETLGEEEWVLDNARFGVDTHAVFEYPASCVEMGVQYQPCFPDPDTMIKNAVEACPVAGTILL